MLPTTRILEAIASWSTRDHAPETFTRHGTQRSCVGSKGASIPEVSKRPITGLSKSMLTRKQLMRGFRGGQKILPGNRTRSHALRSIRHLEFPSNRVNRPLGFAAVNRKFS